MATPEQAQGAWVAPGEDTLVAVRLVALTLDQLGRIPEALVAHTRARA